MTTTTTTPARASRPAPNQAPSLADRVLALAGLTGAIFYATGALLPGSAPNPDATTPQVVAYSPTSAAPCSPGTPWNSSPSPSSCASWGNCAPWSAPPPAAARLSPLPRPQAGWS
jgi:hypothetical protein